MERNILVDRLKGYACFLVLFGHVIMGIRNAGVYMPEVFFGVEKFIWSFHVSLFLFLSGVVYRLTNEWRGKETKGRFIKHKMINLGIPYLIFSVVYILINSFSGQANTQSAVLDILFIWKTPIAQYWFLYALFFLFFIWTVFSDTMKNWQITVFVVLAAYLAPFFGVQWGSFEVVLYSALAFGLGTCVTDIEKIANLNIVCKMLIVAGHILVAVALIKFDIIERSYVKEGIMLLGIYSSIMFVSLIMKIKPFAKFLDFINKYSLQIYLLHTIFTAGIRIILLRLEVTQWAVHVLAGCVGGIAFSVLAAIVASKVTLFNICFFPTKAYAHLRKKP